MLRWSLGCFFFAADYANRWPGAGIEGQLRRGPACIRVLSQPGKKTKLLRGGNSCPLQSPCSI
jgi:hypothetical protein